MDPTECWDRMKQAIIDGDVAEALDASIDLGMWLNRGGFFPEADDGVKPKEWQRHVWAVLAFMATIRLERSDAL